MARRPNILVVDDDPLTRRLLEVALGPAGFAVQTATNGQEAIDLIEAGYRPAVVLLDLVMPVLDGQAFYQALQLLPAAMGIAVIGLTGDDETAVAFETILKPIRMDHLIARLRVLTAPAPPATPAAVTPVELRARARRRRFKVLAALIVGALIKGLFELLK